MEYAVYSNAYLFGIRTNWHENGMVSSVCTRTNGVRWGEGWTYSRSGRLMAHGTFSNGYLIAGTDALWSGGIPAIVSYTNGVFVEEWQDDAEK